MRSSAGSAVKVLHLTHEYLHHLLLLFVRQQIEREKVRREAHHGLKMIYPQAVDR